MLVSIQGLVKQYGTRRALDGVSFDVGAGEIVALLGPNGAGKTTLIGCLLGFLLPTEGSVHLWGQNAADLAPALRGRTGFVPQSMTGFAWFRVGELIDYLARFYATPPGPTDPSLLAWAGLDLAAKVKSLSGGQKQRLAILLALRHSPDLLILDEPVASLDPLARRDFMALLADYARGTGRSVLISSHILSDLERIATRLVFLRQGRVVHDTSMHRFRLSTRWLLPPPGAAARLRDCLPAGLTLLRTDPQGALLVDGWNEGAAAQLGARLGAEVSVRAPDLETAFLDITG